MPGLDAGPDLALLIQAAQTSGEIALRHFEGDRTPTEKPGGQGPVTQADLEVDALLNETLLGARPDYGWLSEETPDSEARLAYDRVFICDPIDGTRAFVEGSRSWAHSLAIAEKGEVTAAVVYLPALGKLYTASKGRGAFLNGKAIAVDPAAGEAGELLAAKPNYAPENWPGGVTPMKRSFRSSLANRLALVAEARFAAMLSLRPVWEWDVAAGALIAAEAGAKVTTMTGDRLRFNSTGAKQNGILAGPLTLHGTLLGRLTGARP